MRKILSAGLLLVFAGCLFFSFLPAKAPKFKAGDVLFISNPAGQGKAIQLATKSKYTHVGVVLPDAKGRLIVYHAVEPVKKNTIAEFLAYSADGKYEHMRLRDTNIVANGAIQTLVAEADKLLGRPYDKAFSWTDMQIYCSEFVWKIYKRAYSIELGSLRTLESFDLTSPIVKAQLKARYGDNVPLDEKVISPADVHDSEWLVKVN